VVVEESEDGGRAVELTESEAEAGGGDDAAPALADERGAEEARGVVWRDAEEDLLHELVHQLRRRRPRSHADRSRAVWSAEEQLSSDSARWGQVRSHRR
jgi:hypothetical protein